MCFDPYVLERITSSRLEELRSEAARRATVRSVHRSRGVFATLRAFFTGRPRALAGRRAVGPRHA